ncbi:C39 family peptidase [Candidatus Saccharibacteria bacterium]|nr:C39 family peptidase [Candidatus Saccharibacteria bacterium]
MNKRQKVARKYTRAGKHQALSRSKLIKRVRIVLSIALILAVFGGSIYAYLASNEGYKLSRAIIAFEGAKQRQVNRYERLQESISAAETILANENAESMNNGELLTQLQESVDSAKDLEVISDVSEGAQDKSRLVSEAAGELREQTGKIEQADEQLREVTRQVRDDLLVKAKSNLSESVEQAKQSLKDASGTARSGLESLIKAAEQTLDKSTDLTEIREKKAQLDESVAKVRASKQAAAASVLKQYAAQPVRRNVVEAPVVTVSPCPTPAIAGLACFSQKDTAWANVKVGQWKFGSTGCVPTSIAMVMHKYGNGTSPLGWGWRLYDAGLYNFYVTGGTSDSVIWAANYMGLWHDNISSLNALTERLQQGYPVIALVRPPYTVPNTTHAIVLNGYNNGQTQVLDPLANRVSGWHSVADIFAHRSDDKIDYGTTGTVFTAIGRAPVITPPVIIPPVIDDESEEE